MDLIVSSVRHKLVAVADFTTILEPWIVFDSRIVSSKITEHGTFRLFITHNMNVF